MLFYSVFFYLWLKTGICGVQFLMFDVDILIENLGVERYGVRCRVEGWNGGVVMRL